MYQSKVSSMVSDFMNRKNKLESKIKEKVVTIDKEISELNEEFRKQQDSFVKCDLVDDENGKKRASVKISEIQLKIKDLEGKREAYTRTNTKDPDDNPEIDRIKATAVLECKDIWNQMGACDEHIKEIKKEIKELEEQAEEEEHKKRLLQNVMDFHIPMSMTRISGYLYEDKEIKKQIGYGRTVTDYIAGNLRNTALAHLVTTSVPEPTPTLVHEFNQEVNMIIGESDGGCRIRLNIISGQGILPRGSVLGVIEGSKTSDRNGNQVLNARLSDINAKDGSQCAKYILNEKVDTTQDSVFASACTMGRFNRGALTFASGNTAADHEASLKKHDILI